LDRPEDRGGRGTLRLDAPTRIRSPRPNCNASVNGSLDVAAPPRSSASWREEHPGLLQRGRLAVGLGGLIALSLMALGSSTLWHALGVPALEPSFADTRVITTGWDCTRAGYDVLRDNPCDPWGRPMNYPRLWTLPAWLGFGEGATAALAVSFGLAFLVVIVALAVSTPVAIALLFGLASPSVLLALERGNNDLVVFAVVAWAARRRSWLALLTAVVLKLYPLAAITSLPSWRSRVLLLGGSAAYFALTLGDLAEINSATPHFASWSYGLQTTVSTFAAVPVVAIAAIVIGMVAGRGKRLQSPIFTAGAVIFLATYLLGPSWDYRRIFLLMTIPALVDGRRWPLLTLVFGTLWLSTGAANPGFIVDQVVTLVSVTALTTALIREPVTQFVAGQMQARRSLAR
jgi:hypothetical protein